jgi:hypothetical protein
VHFVFLNFATQASSWLLSLFAARVSRGSSWLIILFATVAGMYGTELLWDIALKSDTDYPRRLMVEAGTHAERTPINLKGSPFSERE